MVRTKHDLSGDQRQDGAVDITRLLSKYGDQHIAQVIDLFLNEAPAQIEKIQQAVEAQDTAAVMDTAHGLKGMCTAICAKSLWHLMVDLESAAMQADWPAIKHMVGQTLVNYQHVVDALFAFKKETAAKEEQ